MTRPARPIPERHLRPPMGWNSWDCYGTTVTEEEVLAPTSPTETIELLTNDEALDVLWPSGDNREVLREKDLVLWTARDTDGRTRYAAVFSLADRPEHVSVPLGSIGAGPADRVRDVWTRTDTPHDGHCLSASLPAHGAALYRLTPPGTTG